MATNPWVSRGARNEQGLYEDLVIESLDTDENLQYLFELAKYNKHLSEYVEDSPAPTNQPSP